MFANIIGFIFSIIALAGSALFSYSYLEQKTSSTKDVPVVVSEQPTTTTTTPIIRTPASQKSTTKTTIVKTPANANGSLIPSTAIVQKTVVAPGPLRVTVQPINPSPATLTASGVVEYTNIARAQNGALPPLARNALLDNDARMKLEDMFAKQYFEHVSPIGTTIEDLAKAVGYAYVTVGENLALGDFASDTKLVDAWMNSPGHRANILNLHYQEIGVAVGKGMYEGRMTWLAVQSFGTPLSACPVIDSVKKAQIDANNIEISRMKVALDAKKATLDATPQYDVNYNTYVAEFNALIPPYNTLVESNRALVAEYNAGVQAFNSCISSVGTTVAH